MPLDVDSIWKLPYPPERSSYVYDKSSNVISVSLDGGMSRSRVDIIGGTSIVSCEWFLENNQYDYFMAFYNIIAAKGARPFKADLILDSSSVQEFTCRFVPNTLQTSEPSALSHHVSVELEVEPLPDEEKTFVWFLYTHDPVGFESLLAKIASTVNTDFDIFGL